MTRPTFTSSISLGNVLTIAALLIAGVAAFVRVEGQTQENARAIEMVRAEVSQHDDRIRSAELNAARSEERLTSIYTILARMDGRLERIEARE